MIHDGNDATGYAGANYMFDDDDDDDEKGT
jgi:hypothetical protein